MLTIFFDLDGTLIDASERHYMVYKDVLKFYRIPNTLSKEEFWNQKRMGRKTVELLPKNSSKELIQKFMGEWLKRVEDKEYLKYDRLLPESLDVLSQLKDKSELILETLRNNKQNLFWELSDFGLTDYFKEILVGSPLKLKNKVPLIKECLKKYPRKNKFVIVGDSEVDMSTGKERGMLTIAVTYGIRSKDFLKKLNPNFCLDNLYEIFEILKEIGDEPCVRVS